MVRNKGFKDIREVANHYADDLKNEGYDYTDTLMYKSLSHIMFNNPTLFTFIQDYLNKIMVLYVDAVRIVKIYYNYTVKKDCKKIN